MLWGLTDSGVAGGRAFFFIFFFQPKGTQTSGIFICTKYSHDTVVKKLNKIKKIIIRKNVCQK